MELRDLELLVNRIDINLKENQNRGINLHLSREEAILFRKMLDKEIGLRRLMDVPTKRKSLKEQWEEQRGKE